MPVGAVIRSVGLLANPPAVDPVAAPVIPIREGGGGGGGGGGGAEDCPTAAGVWTGTPSGEARGTVDAEGGLTGRDAGTAAGVAAVLAAADGTAAPAMECATLDGEGASPRALVARASAGTAPPAGGTGTTGLAGASTPASPDDRVLPATCVCGPLA